MECPEYDCRGLVAVAEFSVTGLHLSWQLHSDLLLGGKPRFSRVSNRIFTGVASSVELPGCGFSLASSGGSLLSSIVTSWASQALVDQL